MQTIAGAPEEIFQLYCPVKEAHWCEGWDPVVVYSESGVVEPDCIFVTDDGEHESTWFVTVQDLEQGRVEMIKHTPGMTCVKLCISLEPVNSAATRATISYSYTALSEAGEQELAAFTAKGYAVMMQAWEKAMNHYLKTGKMLTGLAEF